MDWAPRRAATPPGLCERKRPTGRQVGKHRHGLPSTSKACQGLWLQRSATLPSAPRTASRSRSVKKRRCPSSVHGRAVPCRVVSHGGRPLACPRGGAGPACVGPVGRVARVTPASLSAHHPRCHSGPALAKDSTQDSAQDPGSTRTAPHRAAQRAPPADWSLMSRAPGLAKGRKGSRRLAWSTAMMALTMATLQLSCCSVLLAAPPVRAYRVNGGR